MIPRLLHLNVDETFFLWGPRQVGKSSLLKERFPDTRFINLLHADEYRKYMQNPERLRYEIAASGENFVIIDEIQRVPELLNEVHALIEEKQVRFGLCGSSARKIKHGRANLLGGRGLRYELYGLSAVELKDQFDLQHALNYGYFPKIYLSSHPLPLLNAYIANYLKEEIAAEGLVRNLPLFAEFLTSAAFSDGEVVNFSSIARDCGISNQGIKGYFDILIDTLLGSWLPAYVKRPKRRVIKAPKFYFCDVGLVNILLKRKEVEPKSELWGKAFENWLMHELRCYNTYQERHADLFYWRTTSGFEVDFIVNKMDVAIEAKAVGNIKSDHLKGLRALKEDYPEIGKRIVVCMESQSLRTDDGIDILPYTVFLDRLWAGEIF